MISHSELSLFAKDKFYRLIIQSSQGKPENLKQYLEENKSNIIGLMRSPLLSYAIIEGHIPTIQLLLDAGMSLNYIILDTERKQTTPLILAIEQENYELVDFLLQNAANPNLNTSYNSPMHAAACIKDEPLREYFLTELLKLRGKPDLALSNGFTPLHCLALHDRSKNCKSAQLLIDKGANINACMEINSQTYLRLLNISNNTCIYLLNYTHITPLELSLIRKNEPMIKLLLSFEATLFRETLKRCLLLLPVVKKELEIQNKPVPAKYELYYGNLQKDVEALQDNICALNP